MPDRRSNHPSGEAAPAASPGDRPRRGQRRQQGHRPGGRIPRTGSDTENSAPQQPTSAPETQRPPRNNHGQGRGSGGGNQGRGQNRGQNRRPNRIDAQGGQPPERGPENTGQAESQAGGQANGRGQNQRRGQPRREGGPRGARRQNQFRSQYRSEGGMTTREPDTEQITRGPQATAGAPEGQAESNRPERGRNNFRANNHRQGGRGRGDRNPNRRPPGGEPAAGVSTAGDGSPNGEPAQPRTGENRSDGQRFGGERGVQQRRGDRRGNARREGGQRGSEPRRGRPEEPAREPLNASGAPDAPNAQPGQGQGQRGPRSGRGRPGERSGSRGDQAPRRDQSPRGEQAPRSDRAPRGQHNGADQPRNQKSPARRKPRNQRPEHAPYIPPNGEVIVEGRESTPPRQRPPRRQRENGYERGEGYYSFTGYNYDRPAPTVPIRTNQGIKARSQRGAFSKNWWARRWIESMEQLVDPGRLQRGRSYARSGQVLSIDETQHGIAARVQGSRPKPYDVTIQVTPLTDQQWDQVIDALAEQALFTAQLLAGEMPANIEDAFNTAQVSLFPTRAGDLFTSCSCPDWANPCKHVAATHYILGDRFDDDPFLLFRMRGRSQEQILQALRARRAGMSELPPEEVAPEPVEMEAAQPLEDALEHFWEPVEPLDTFPLTIRPPSMDMPLLKRLGDPAFLAGESLQDLLKPVYDTFTRSALRAAYSEEEPLEPSNGDAGEDADTTHPNGAEEAL